MGAWASLYSDHLAILQQRIRSVLERHQLEALLIHSGELLSLFLDDRDYPFKVNPQFKAWLPVLQVPHCWLWVDGVNPPKLYFYAPIDHWHSVTALETSFWTSQVGITILCKADDIGQMLPKGQAVAYIGYVPQRALSLGIKAEHINPQPVLDYLHYYRAYKTEYELACLREAQKYAVIGHRAAQAAYADCVSEFEINQRYLVATGQRDTDVPYDNIVAFNEHAAILHYTQLQQQAPTKRRSFLLDAGAQYQGYAADVTRTYAANRNSDFAALIIDLDQQHQALIATMKVGVRYLEYHCQMHQRLAGILKRHHILRDISVEAAVAQGLTTPFLPHGLGHPLGLQVHDVAGFMQDDQGTHLAPPSLHPYLRCTRVMEPGMVMTVEPGLYFIDTLLTPWREGKLSQYFNWSRIDSLRPYGGIRIEDNVIFHEQRVENMTRDLSLN